MNKITLRRSRIPSDLHPLIPLAAKYGVADDLERESLVASSTDAELKELKAAVGAHEEALDRWLAGPEAKGPQYSDEYIAFSAMRMAADYA